MPSSSPPSPGESHRCPVCRRTLQRSYTLRGLLWAMVCFPCGMYCCMRRLRRRCTACESDVIISDGGVPTVAQTYNTFAEFKWQFPPSALRRKSANPKHDKDHDDDDDNGDDQHHGSNDQETEIQRLCPAPRPSNQQQQ